MRFVSLLLVIPAFVAGCERDATQAVAPSPAAEAPQRAESAPAVVAAEEVEPATRPTTAPAGAAAIRVNDDFFEFPAARARVEPSPTDTTILLYSDDPPDAINDEYQGNSFYLKLQVEPEAAEGLPGTVWTYAAENRKRQDSPNGIFLDGVKQQLQPHDVRVEFEGTQAEPVVVLSGTFLRFDGEDRDQAPEEVAVQARLPAKLVQAKQ